jgi:ketosteroid isomerase-like protein
MVLAQPALSNQGGNMKSATAPSTETEIRSLIESRARAVRMKDLDAATSRLAPAVHTFDIVESAQYMGAAQIRKRQSEWFGLFDGNIGCEIRDLCIVAGDNVAFAHSLNRYSGHRKGGQTESMWVRSTVCLKRVFDKWQIVHEHSSIPCDPTTGKSSLNMAPVISQIAPNFQ